ncbi:hypothetical protein N8J89_32750 [Crossiella sp. CA-258035]|uniref:hypothetical protein n=1 Tax=Crossiella sp. CA-258035 TaxID=2981138 RepID=UPI0024BCA8F1|nr:hypothetical protein [Crossiella sp. CA-258035]WHT17852.1 hypothetical protein N8J89_32750 [Crossiella sp. CA-258035]
MALTNANIPLGPLAGAELTLWCAKSGRLWHGDSSCPDLKQRAREVVQVQPRKGSSQTWCHRAVCCVPPGLLADHFAAGQALVEFDGRTDSLTQQLAQGKIDLTAFDLVALRQEHPNAVRAPLAKVWRQCRERREAFLAELSDELTSRLPMMVAAAWLRTNKRSKQHVKRRKYARFKDLAVHKFDQIDRLSPQDVRELAGRHVLPKFLGLVKDGEHPSSAAAKVSAEQAEWARRSVEEALSERPEQADEGWATLPDRVHEAWQKTVQLWIGLLNGICTAHHGETFALFHEGQLPLPTYALHRLFPCARIRTTTFTWLAGPIPAIFRLFLQERIVGLIGLEVDREHSHVYRDKRPAWFLKNLFTWHGFPELAKHVETVASDPPRKPPLDTSHIDNYFRGFGYGIHDNGLIAAQCNYAASMAWRDRRLRKG